MAGNTMDNIQALFREEENKRKELILRILLAGSIVLASVALTINLIDVLLHHALSVSPFVSAYILLFFLFLRSLSKKGYGRISAYFFIATYVIPLTYASYKWGANLPIASLGYALIIIMTGIVISTRAAFLVTLFVILITVVLAELQIRSLITPNFYWLEEPLKMANLAVYLAILGIIYTVSWLSNREIEKSLQRARKSEEELKKERDSLEIKVEERTKQLKTAQAEKVSQLYRFAEFGRLSAGLFHDLINPLTAVSLNLGQIKPSPDQKETAELKKARHHLKEAFEASKKMESFIISARKQLQKESRPEEFSLSEEIIQILKILTYNANKAKVELCFEPAKDFRIYGDSVKFSQIIINLISNAIDSYRSIKRPDNRRVIIRLKEHDGFLILQVHDFGSGIEKELLPKIFEPFFTTKFEHNGIGIGLSTTKTLIEKDFGGSIKVDSIKNQGATFTAAFPLGLKN